MIRRCGWFLISLVAASGCGSGSSTPSMRANPFAGVEVSVVSVGDSAILADLQPEAAAWSSEAGAKVKIVAEAAPPGKLGGAEVVVFPGDRLGELVDSGDLAVILDSTVRPPIPLGKVEAVRDPLAFNDVVPAYRDLVSKYGEDRMGLALGGSALVVVYRRDAFESESNLKAAREAGIALVAPETWEDLDALARFFHGRDWDGDGKPQSGISAALGEDREGVGDALFLARAASLGQHRDHFGFLFDPETLAPRVESPPFVEALNGVTAWAKLAPAGASKFDAEAARKAFREGEAAILIDRAEQPSRWTDPKHPSSVGVAWLPGSRRVFDPDTKAWQAANPPNRPTYLPRGGGWLVGIGASASGKQAEAAIALARTLAGPESSRNLAASRSSPMIPVRGVQLGGLPNPRNAPNVDSPAWGVTVAKTVTTPRVLPGLRIPGTSRYLAAVTKARVAALGGQPAESALATLSKEWAVLSQELGPAKQLWHYRRSLNRLITEPHPPSGDDGRGAGDGKKKP